MEAAMPEIAIVLGSDSDLPKIKGCFDVLETFGVSFEVIISSAHRTPEKTKEWAKSAPDRGVKVIIAVAGGAAHLPGVVAAFTTIPVIGVPIATNIAGGIDSVLSILQMPSGIPVATMPAGSAGGTNAALFAVSILSTTESGYRDKLLAYREDMGAVIAQKNEKLQKMGYSDYIKMLEGK